MTAAKEYYPFMKFLGAVIAYLVIAFILASGILLAVRGNFWLLALGFLAYLLAFARIGCAPSDQPH